MENRQINSDYRAIAEELLATEPELSYIHNSDVKIEYLESDLQKKTKTGIVHGECEKVASKNQWAIKADFTITFFKPNNQQFTPEQMKILMFHELLHVGIEVDNEGKEKYFVVPHDYEEFKLIINKFGANWSDTRD